MIAVRLGVVVFVGGFARNLAGVISSPMRGGVELITKVYVNSPTFALHRSILLLVEGGRKSHVAMNAYSFTSTAILHKKHGTMWHGGRILRSKLLYTAGGMIQELEIAKMCSFSPIPQPLVLYASPWRS